MSGRRRPLKGAEARRIPKYMGSTCDLMNYRERLMKLASWCDGEENLDDTITLTTPNGVVRAQPGQYIVRSEGDIFTVHDDNVLDVPLRNRPKRSHKKKEEYAEIPQEAG